jgi:hypothetical protein
MRLGPFQEERDEENIVNAILKEIVRLFCCGSCVTSIAGSHGGA